MNGEIRKPKLLDFKTPEVMENKVITAMSSIIVIAEEHLVLAQVNI